MRLKKAHNNRKRKDWRALRERLSARLKAARPMPVRIAEAIKRNVDNYYADRITYEQMSARQDTLWRGAEHYGPATVERVTELVRPTYQSMAHLGVEFYAESEAR